MGELRIQINDRATPHLADLIARLQRAEPLMRGISLELLSLTERAFEKEGDPERWKSLASRTILQRSKKGHWPGKMLQVSTAGLAASVQPFHSGTQAGIQAGSGKSAAYAAIHQFGGQAGRGRRTTIPARPYLPFRGTGASAELTTGAQRSITSLTLDYIAGKT